MTSITRRRLLTTGLVATAGVAGAALMPGLARRRGLIPPDACGAYAGAPRSRMPPSACSPGTPSLASFRAA